MPQKYKVLVFPCGSEIGLEIHRSLKYSTHVDLIGGSSVLDHGRFIYEHYIDGFPFHDQPDFLLHLKKVIKEHKIDAIFPAMDSVIVTLASAAEELGCTIISSPASTTQICLSKTRTYTLFKNIINTPQIFEAISSIVSYPVFMKPDVGYGSRGAKKISDRRQAEVHLTSHPTSIILEYLPGSEYTVDCFTNKNGELLFSKARKRDRINNGISVHTMPEHRRTKEFLQMAEEINRVLRLRGAWFFQVKENSSGKLVLLEIASRLGGSSSLFRNLGVNFALLSIFDAFDHEVALFYNNYNIELDRALSNKYKIDIQFKTAYVDFDDCLLLDDKINTELISLLFQYVNEGKKIILITKHGKEVEETLKIYRISGLFDEIIHLTKTDKKYQHMLEMDSIFIDDSFAERYEVCQHLGIPVFAPDNIECLLK